MVGDGSINKKEAGGGPHPKIAARDRAALPERLLFLDVDTAVCAPLAPVFSCLRSPRRFRDALAAIDGRGWWSSAPLTASRALGRRRRAFVPVDGGKHAASSRSRRSACRASSSRQHGRAARAQLGGASGSSSSGSTYIYETRDHAHLMDQPAFRIALWRTNASHVALCARSTAAAGTGARPCRSRAAARRRARRAHGRAAAAAAAAAMRAAQPSSRATRERRRRRRRRERAAAQRLHDGAREPPRDAELRLLLVLFPGVGTRDDDRFVGSLVAARAGGDRVARGARRCAAGCALFVLFPDPAATAARPTDAHSHVLLEALLAVTTTPDWSDAAARRERDGDATEADLQLVLGWLESRCAAVGLAARSEESLELFETALGQRERDGAASTKRTHTRAARAALNWTGSALDKPLYDGAVALFERQLRVMAREE